MSQAKHDFVPFHVPLCSDKLQEIARTELGETEDLKENCLQQLRLLIRDHKVNSISTDDYLLRFLRVKKFDVRRSFGILRNCASQLPLLLKCLLEQPPGLLETCFRLNIIGLFPYRDSEGRLVVFFRGAFWNPNICSPHELITLFFLMGTYLASNKSSQTTGLAFVIDLKSMSLLHASLFLSTVNRWRNFCFNCIPIRYASGHIVSDSIIIKYATLLVLPIVPKKIRDRFVFHKDFGASFYEYFPRDILPDHFGGTIRPLDCERQIQVMRDQLQKLKDEIHYFQHRT